MVADGEMRNTSRDNNKIKKNTFLRWGSSVATVESLKGHIYP